MDMEEKVVINDVRFEVVEGYTNKIILNDYEKKQIEKIKEWKRTEPSVISKALETVAKPLSWAAGKVIPEAAIKKSLEFSNEIAAFLVDKTEITNAAAIKRINELREATLECCDQLSARVKKEAVASAVIEGGGTGILGLLGIAIDIPVLVTIALRTIYRVGLCYGYEMDKEEDHEFVIGILSSTSANTALEKLTALTYMKRFQRTVSILSAKIIAEKLAEKNVGREAGRVTVQSLSKQLGVNLTKRKMLTSVPVIGAVVGGTVNGWYMSDVAVAAIRIFQERWFIDNEKADEIDFYNI